MVTYMGRRLDFRGQPCPSPRTQGLGTPKFLEFISVYARTLYHRTTKVHVVTRGGGACVLGLAMPPIPRNQGSSGPPFLAFSCIYAYAL